MQSKRYKPKIDKLFYIIWIPTGILMLAVTVLTAFFEPKILFWMLPIDVFVAYFLVSSLAGCVILRETSIFIKYGFILKKEIPYSKIRSIDVTRKWYSDSMLSLKNSLEHVNIKYNTFDVTTVSVEDNNDFVEELNNAIKSALN
ncbi:MAG: PH domain-containing protein [Clostridia bacterium]|nr:PH domain-containing protein [Clostridia bacterium]